MNASTWLIIAIVGFSLSGIALVAVVFMFIKMNIPAVIGDLSGKTVAREIRAMRDANASSGDKLHKSSRVNANRGKLTSKIDDGEAGDSIKAVAHASKRLDRTGTGHFSERLKNEETGGLSSRIAESSQVPVLSDKTTESLSDNVGEVDIEKRRATAVLSQNCVTDILSNENASATGAGTEVLFAVPQTDVLSATSATEVLNDATVISRGGTIVLGETEELVPISVSPVSFKVTRSMVAIHTNEVI